MRCWACGRDNRTGVRFCATCGAGLGCPDCGTPLAAGQRFCTSCGRRAPVRGAQTIVRPIERKRLDTPHFRVRYLGDSFAAQGIDGIGARLEAAYTAASAMLGLTAPLRAPIEVHLVDMLEHPALPGMPLSGGGFAVPERLEMREVYRPDAPGDMLERSLVQILLAETTGDPRPQPWLFQEGLLARVRQSMGAYPPDEALAPELAQLRQGRNLPPVTMLLTGGDGDVAVASAAGFLGFLLTLGGPEKLRAFLRALDPARPDEAARLAYGQTLAALDKNWRKTLRQARPGGILRFLKHSSVYLKPHKVKVTEIVLYISMAVAFGVGLQKMQQVLVDRALPGFDPATGTARAGDSHTLFVLMAILVGAFVVVSLASLRESYLTAWVSERVLADLNRRIFANLQRMPPAFYQRYGTGDILSRMTSDIGQVDFALSGALAQGLRIILTLVAAVITIMFLDWKLGLLALVFTPLLFLAGRWLGPAAAKASYARQERAAEATGTLQENLAAQPVVKAFGLQERMVDNYARALNDLFRASLRLTFLSGIFGLSASSIASAIQLMVLGVGAYLVIEGNLTIGILFAFLGLLGQVIGPMQSISGILQAMQQATGAMDRVEELLHAEPSIKDAPNAVPLPPLAREIRFENVTFGYSPDQPILRNLSLTFPAGKSIALVGPSGCGKSTVLNLLMRFYEPDSGRVTVDGVDIREGTLQSLRLNQGVVFQDNFLFNQSIRENIRMGRPDATDADVEAAAKAAELHDIVLAMPEGYNTVVGERGGRLSGGQRQRVAIARAIIRNPALLLLDEATSALDPRTEAAVNETLDRLARGRTTLGVTHRLASVVNADQIFVFDRGELAEQGTHDDLVKRGGLYATLWQEQGGFVLGAGVQYVGVEASRLQGVPLFNGFDQDLLAALSTRLAVERYPAGDVIVNEGDPGDKLFIIHKGQAEVLAYDPAGRQMPVAVLREGDYFGEMALLYDIPRTATIRALAPIQLYSLTKEDFHILLNAAPAVRQEIDQVVAQRAAELPARR